MPKDWTDIFNRYHGMWLAFDEDEETVLAAANTNLDDLWSSMMSATITCIAQDSKTRLPGLR
jgi:hypothetical protein